MNAVAIRELIGETAFLRLQEIHGGKVVYIPCQAHSGNHLIPIVGLDGLIRLCAKYGGLSIYVPSSHRPKKTILLEKIRAGASDTEIARQLKVTRSYVRMLRKNL